MEPAQPAQLAHQPAPGEMAEPVPKNEDIVVQKALQGGAPKITKLVYNSNNYGLWYL